MRNAIERTVHEERLNPPKNLDSKNFDYEAERRRQYLTGVFVIDAEPTRVILVNDEAARDASCRRCGGSNSSGSSDRAGARRT